MAGAAATSSGRAPGGGTASGPRRTTRSPASPSGSRDVATTVSPSHVADETGGQIPAVIEHVLAVVEHEDRGAGGEALDRHGEEVVAVRRAQAEGGTDSVGELRTLVDRGQLDERHLPRALVEEVGDHLEGQAGLAHAARAHHGDQSLAGDQLRQLGQLALTADEGRGWSGSTRRSARCARGANIPGRDLGLERGHGRGGVEPGLVGQPASQVVHDPQRLGRASLESEDASQHQLGALTERVGGGGASGVVDQRGVGPGASRTSRRRSCRSRRSSSSPTPAAASGATSANSSRAVPRHCPSASRSRPTASPAATCSLRPASGAPRPRRARREQHEAVAVALPDQPVGRPGRGDPHPRHVAVQRTPPRVGDLGGPHRG